MRKEMILPRPKDLMSDEDRYSVNKAGQDNK